MTINNKLKQDRKAARRAKLLSGIDKYMGPEPDPKSIITDLDLGKAYNWYNYSCTTKQLHAWILEFMQNCGKYSPQQIAAFKTVPINRIVITAGSVSRMYNNGASLPDQTLVRTHLKIEHMLTFAQAKEETVIQKNPMSVANRVREHTSSIIGDMEEELDKFFTNDYSSDFKPYDYMKKNDIKAVYASKIASFYEPLKNELQEALTGKDAQLKEGYSRLYKPQLRKYLEFVSTIISDAESIAQINKTTRKTRKPKEKSATQITSKMKYLKESIPYKIASIDPTKIIKAQTLIIFNTKYKKLGIYVAADSNGLSIKGTTIINYDTEKSISKTLRKPEDVLPSVLNNGKLAFNKTFNGIKTAPSALNGRITGDTILVRIL